MDASTLTRVHIEQTRPLPRTVLPPVRKPIVEDVPFKDPSLSPIAMAGAIALGAVVLSLVTYCIWWSFQTYTEAGSVTSMSWEQRVHRDNWQSITREDWKKGLWIRPTVFPTNGTGESAGIDNIRNCRDKYHHTRHYVCGSEYKCHDATRSVRAGESCHTSCSNNHNGSRTCHESCSPKYKTEHYQKCGNEDKYCDEKIYEKWCQYDTWEWAEVDVKRLSGTDNNTDWPKVVPGPLDRLRRDADYRINVAYVEDGERQTTYDTPDSESEFRTWTVGAPAEVVIFNMGAVSEVRHPQEKPQVEK